MTKRCILPSLPMLLLFLALLVSVLSGISHAGSRPVTRHEYETFTKVRKLLAEDRIDDAHELMKRYFRRSGRKHSLGYEIYGYILMTQKHTKTATEILEEGFALYPGSANIAQNLGAAHGRTGNNVRAAEMFYTAYTLFKDKKPRLAFTSAVFYHRAKKYRKCIDVLTPLLALPESKSRWHLLQAMCHLEQKQFSQAALFLEKSLKRFPEEARMWRMLGFAHYRLGNTDRAAATYEIAYRLKPPSQAEVKQMITLYSAIGAPHLGEQYVEEGTSVDAQVLDRLAYGLACSGNLESALQKTEDALKKEPTATRRFRQGILLMRMDRKTEARNVFSPLTKTKGKIGGKANWALAMMAWAEEEWVDVLTYLERAGRADPGLVKRSKRLTKVVRSVLEAPPIPQ